LPDWEAFDLRSRLLGELSRSQFRSACLGMSSVQRPEMMRMRMRSRLDEFAEHVMAPILARRSKVSPPCELDHSIYGGDQPRVGYRGPTRYRLWLASRGFGKTTRLKILAFHGMIYGLTQVGVAIGQTDPDGVGWIASLRDWAENPSDELAMLFPELETGGDQHHLTTTTDYGGSVLVAKGFGASFRGINVLTARPDRLYLDDIESEDKSRTSRSRDGNQERLLGKVLPLVPIDGGAEIYWVQTPVHPDCVAARATKRADAFRSWTSRKIPIIRKWPDRADLWEQCRHIYYDIDTHGDLEASKAAAKAFHAERKEEMDAGAVVLAPTIRDVYGCHSLRWDVGESSWAREYEMSVSVLGGGVLGLDRWPRFHLAGDHIRIGQAEVLITDMRLTAHYDPSDGGDDGALVVVGEWHGRYYVLGSKVWQTARLSVQVRGIPDALAPWVALGLQELQWEPTPGSASVVRTQILDACTAAGLAITLVDRHSSEQKEARITAMLEPLGAGGLIALPDDLDPRLEAQGQDFDPSQRDNDDDWLDALQRAIERHQTREEEAADPEAVFAALRAEGLFEDVW